jgi:alkaline phosphatase D
MDVKTISPAPFDVEPLRDLVAAGLVTDRAARLWWRTDRPGPHRLEIAAPDDERPPVEVAPPPPERDGTTSVLYPDDFPGGAPLAPGRRYVARVWAAGELVGEARFETAPARPDATPARVTFGVVSCHQPFDEEGRVRPDATSMLAAAEQAFVEADVTRLFLVGDQIYADGPPGRSLLPAPPAEGAGLLAAAPEEIRRAYQERYRAFWGVPGFARLQSLCAGTCILDDHEIVDDFGSRAEHATPGWGRVREGALAAFFDYQGARARARTPERPPTFHHAFRYGAVGIFVADLRSGRRPDPAENRLLGDAQLADLDAFLAGAGDCHTVLVVLSVPLLFLPDSVTTLGLQVLGDDSEFADRWSAPRNRPERDRLVALLRRQRRLFPRQQIVLLSGDIHVGCAATMRFREAPDAPIYQLVSSAVTNAGHGLRQRLAKATTRLLPLADGDDFDASLLPGTSAADANPYNGLNVGLLEIETTPSGGRLRWRLVSHDEAKPGAPVVVFDSGPLG